MKRKRSTSSGRLSQWDVADAQFTVTHFYRPPPGPVSTIGADDDNDDDADDDGDDGVAAALAGDHGAGHHCSSSAATCCSIAAPCLSKQQQAGLQPVQVRVGLTAAASDTLTVLADPGNAAVDPVPLALSTALGHFPALRCVRAEVSGLRFLI